MVSLVFLFVYVLLGFTYFTFGAYLNPPDTDEDMADHVVISIFWPLGAAFNLLSNFFMIADNIFKGRVVKSLAYVGNRLAKLFI